MTDVLWNSAEGFTFVFVRVQTKKRQKNTLQIRIMDERTEREYGIIQSRREMGQNTKIQWRHPFRCCWLSVKCVYCSYEGTEREEKHWTRKSPWEGGATEGRWKISIHYVIGSITRCLIVGWNEGFLTVRRELNHIRINDLSEERPHEVFHWGNIREITIQSKQISLEKHRSTISDYPFESMLTALYLTVLSIRKTSWRDRTRGGTLHGIIYK